MGFQSMKDPLDLFGDLPDFPGKTPPKNRLVENTVANHGFDRYNNAKSKVYIINGVSQQFFTVGEFAKALGRKAGTIRMWEHRGILPKANFRTPPPGGSQLPGKEPKGRRLYSLTQLDFIIDTVEKFHLDDPIKAQWEAAKAHIKNNWPR